MTAALIIFGVAIAAALLYAAARFGDRPSRAESRQFEASLDAAWQKAPPAPALHHDWHAAPTITLAPAVPDATPNSGPAAGARAPEPPAGDEAPGPDGAPEGDEPAARPPQGTTGPGDLSPLARAKAAMDEVARLGTDEYLGHLDAATGYADDGPWCPLSDATLARGIPAIKADA